MKSNEFDSKAFESLLKKTKALDAPEPPVLGKAVHQLIHAFLWWEAKQDQAEDAMAKLFAAVLDVNELRVTRDAELIAVLGPRYPLVEERVMRLRESLNAVYNREHANEMQSIAAAGKKEQKQYLDTLPGAPSFVASQVMLLAFGGHAMPVDDKLVRVLAQAGVVPEHAAPEDVEAQLLRHVRANEALDVHMKLQAYADANAKITLNSPRMTDRALERPDGHRYVPRVARPKPEPDPAAKPEKAAKPQKSGKAEKTTKKHASKGKKTTSRKKKATDKS